MDYPRYAKIGDKKYPINTDFRVAIECNDIALDETIGDYERALAIIYKLFGDKGLNDTNNQVKLLEIAQKYLSCGKELDTTNNIEPDMDFSEDMDYIEASFMSDYNIDLSNAKMHWWKFINLMNGLSNSELGNCCVLNRIRNIRTFDTKDIKDEKTLKEINEAKKQVALNKYKKENHLTKEQEESMARINKIMGL